jgi:Protein of unknown function (DUF4242)
MPLLKRFMIERDIPGIEKMSAAELCGAARSSNCAIDQLAGSVQWVHSYIAADKTFCIYLAEDADAVRKHSEISGIPAQRIVELTSVIDPLTAVG